MIRLTQSARAATFALLGFLLAHSARAQAPATVGGAVTDALGARVPNVTVTLTGDRGPARETTSTGDGVYTFDNVAPGRYQVTATTSGFEPFTSDPFYVSSGARQTIDAILQVGPLQQAVVVTAAATGVSQAQTGAPITVIDATTLAALNKPDVLEALRLVPGAQVVQTGAKGGTTSLFVRGGNSNFNKVLIDGAVANDMGGGFDFAQLQTTGIERVEVMRQTNSVMYGSDALAGVVSLTTKRGRTRIPEATLAIDGGNLSTWSTDLGLGGVAKRIDYYSSFRRYETDNDVPNNQYTNGTYAGRFGVALGNQTDLTATVRRTDTTFGSPNAISFYGVADDASATNEVTYVSVTANTMLSNAWQTTIRFGNTDQTSFFTNPTPTGEPSDPFGSGAPTYLGTPVTLTGANDYSVSGRAILEFGGTYPQLSTSQTTRRALSGETTYVVNGLLTVSGGARFEREVAYDEPDSAEREPAATRNNGGVFGEARLTLADRHYITGGIGLEHNEAFGEAVTPRISIASYLRPPSASGPGDTKIVLNAGTGIKAPSAYQAANSVYALVQGTPAASGIAPIGPERSRSFDVGLEQGLMRNRARIRGTYFYNTFRDLLEYLDTNALVRAGVPPAVANAAGFGGYINSQSYRARGLELSFESVVARDLRVMASYTYLDAEVTEAFGASEAFNDRFPGIPIGAFSPLVGERPFRRPANSGTFMVRYAPGHGEIALSTYFSGRRDDSTFLTDEFFGNSLLLPNRDLDPAYQKVDLSGAYRLHPRVRGYASIENLLNQQYEASFGFPALPITARVGVTVTLGGD